MVLGMADDKKTSKKDKGGDKGGGGDKSIIFSKLLPADVLSQPLATRSFFIALLELSKWLGNSAGSMTFAQEWFRKIPSGLEHIVGRDMAKRVADVVLKALLQADVFVGPIANRLGLQRDRVQEVLNDNLDELIEGFTAAVMAGDDFPNEEASLAATARNVNQFLEFGFLSHFKRDAKAPTGPTFVSAFNGLTPVLRGYFVNTVLTEECYESYLRQIFTSTAPCSVEQLRMAIMLDKHPKVRHELILACAGIKKSSDLSKDAATAFKKIEARIAALAGALTDADHPDSVHLREELTHRAVGTEEGVSFLRKITGQGRRPRR